MSGTTIVILLVFAVVMALLLSRLRARPGSPERIARLRPVIIGLALLAVVLGTTVALGVVGR